MLLGHIEAALSSMNELFNALLDISKLDAGALTPNITEFPVAKLLKRVETTFAGPAPGKGLSLQVVPASGWLRSDFILLERIVFNLVANAVRYTNRGGVVVGCRHRGTRLSIRSVTPDPEYRRIEYQNIFSEFYRIGEASRTAAAAADWVLAFRSSRGFAICSITRCAGLNSGSRLPFRPFPSPSPTESASRS